MWGGCHFNPAGQYKPPSSGRPPEQHSSSSRQHEQQQHKQGALLLGLPFAHDHKQAERSKHHFIPGCDGGRAAACRVASMFHVPCRMSGTRGHHQKKLRSSLGERNTVQSRLPSPASEPQNQEAGIQHPESSIQHPESRRERMQHPESRLPAPGPRTVSCPFGTRNTGALHLCALRYVACQCVHSSPMYIYTRHHAIVPSFHRRRRAGAAFLTSKRASE